VISCQRLEYFCKRFYTFTRNSKTEALASRLSSKILLQLIVPGCVTGWRDFQIVAPPASGFNLVLASLRRLQCYLVVGRQSHTHQRIHLNFGPQSYSDRAVSLLVLALAPLHGQVSFFSPPSYLGTGTPFTADFNGDGKLDLLSADGTMQLGKGDGTFTTGTLVTNGVLAIGDFNGDGKQDVLQQGNGALLVLLGNGDGTFQAPIGTDQCDADGSRCGRR
jgi:hypothetical protein